MKDRYVLFTNLDYVTVLGVRTMSHALLLEDVDGLGRRRIAMRGFSTDASVPTFDLFIPSIEYTMETADSSGSFMIMGKGGPRPLSVGAILSIKTPGDLTGLSPLEVQLVAHNRDLPIKVTAYEFEPGEHDGEYPVTQVWRDLRRLVGEAWDKPNMPRPMWGPPSQRMYGIPEDVIRSLLGRVGLSSAAIRDAMEAMERAR